MNEEKDNSLMLGRIAAEVIDWCCDDECTTEDAVKLLKADYCKLFGEFTRMKIERKYYENQ